VSLNPFLYPKAKHRRKLKPSSYSSYVRYKPSLKQEFSSQCVYCCLPDGVKGEDNFGVDHYRPKSKFPELETVYTNLFYACNCCNRRKGNFWPTEEQQKVGEFIPNPCGHLMFDHLRYRSAYVHARSAAGRFTERVLMLNDKESLSYREFVLSTIVTLEEKQRRLHETIRRIDQLCAMNPERADELTEEKAISETQLMELQKALRRLTGGNTPI
jgi:hypothetical protein